MYYQAVSFSHKNCPQDMREKLAFSNDNQKIDMLDTLIAFEFIHEAFIVSTCNRVEIVLATRDNLSSFHAVLGLMSQKSEINFYQLKKIANCFDDEKAVEHIFSVVSSLDSLVIGESQITGQVRDGFNFSLQNKSAKDKLHRLITYANKCGAEVRNATNISQNPISIASVAVAQAHTIFGENIVGMTGVVVGAGEMGVLATKHLLRIGCDVVLLARDIEKLKSIASQLGENVKIDTVDKLPKYINRYRLLFSATSSPTTIINRDIIDNINIDRVWFDMAIPRDIEDMNIDKLRLFRIDDLKAISQNNHALREEQAIKAIDIVQSYRDEFYNWLRALSIEPVIKQMRENVITAIDDELSRALKKGFVPTQYEDNMRKMAIQMFNKFLHQPTQNLRKSSAQKKNANCIESVKKMFDIEIENVDLKQYKNDPHKGYKL